MGVCGEKNTFSYMLSLRTFCMMDYMKDNYCFNVNDCAKRSYNYQLIE